MVCILGVASVSVLMITIYISKILRFFTSMIWNKFVRRQVDNKNEPCANSTINKHQVVNANCGIDMKNMSREVIGELTALLKLAREHKMIPMVVNRGFILYGWTYKSKENFIKTLIHNSGYKVMTVEVYCNDKRIDGRVTNIITDKFETFFKKRAIFFGKHDIVTNLEKPQSEGGQEKGGSKVKISTYIGLGMYRFIH